MDLKLKNNSSLTIPQYSRVEYVESSGYSNIDTGIEINYWYDSNSSYIEAVIEILDETTESSYIWYSGALGGDARFYLKKESGDNQFSAALYNNAANSVSVEISGKSTIKQGRPYIEINGDRTTSTAISQNRKGNLYLLYNGDLKVRIYSFKIKNYSGTLLRDFIPVVSLEKGHIGEAALYDIIENKYYYSASSGSLSAPTPGFYNIIETAYVKDCPNISGIDILRLCTNLTNVRCDIGSVSGTFAEIQHYATLHGFDANEEPDNTVPATINGTFTITDWYTTSELQALQGTITGLTIVGDSSKNIDTALINGDFAIQTLDSTQPNYNPAAAIRLQANGYGITRSTPSTATKGNWFITKDEVATITSLSNNIFGGIASAIDSNKIVSNDDTEEYLFTDFDEFKYFNNVTEVGSYTVDGQGFINCSNLESITIPQGVVGIGGRSTGGAFDGCSSLETITFPSSLGWIGYPDIRYAQYRYVFRGCTNISRVNISSIESYLQISICNMENSPFRFSTVLQKGLYINDELLTSIVIPETITEIKQFAFLNVNTITSVLFHSYISDIGQYAFTGCTGLTGDIDVRTANAENTSFGDTGDYTGTLRVRNYKGANNNDNFIEARYKRILVYGDVSHGNNLPILANKSQTREFRIQGNHNPGNDYYSNEVKHSGSGAGANALKFYEVMGTYYTTYTKPSLFYTNGGIASDFIIHAGYNGIAGKVGTFKISDSKVAHMYVGNGSSRSNDESVLALYLADTDWSAYSAKLATWYDYNGEYKWYYVTDNLTNCTNTNPDEWPYITRGESYQTTIVPDEGMTLDSVTVEMYEAVDNGTTPNTPTDITSSVYDSSTGEINIPSVTGNIIITASAS